MGGGVLRFKNNCREGLQFPLPCRPICPRRKNTCGYTRACARSRIWRTSRAPRAPSTRAPHQATVFATASPAFVAASVPARKVEPTPEAVLGSRPRQPIQPRFSGTAAEEAAEAIITPSSSAAPKQRKKRALQVVWGARAHDAVLAQIDASRRTQVSSQLWARRPRAHHATGGGGGGREARRGLAAEGQEGDDDARALVRQRANGGNGDDEDMIRLRTEVRVRRPPTGSTGSPALDVVWCGTGGATLGRA